MRLEKVSKGPAMHFLTKIYFSKVHFDIRHLALGTSLEGYTVVR
jgi:hypothetical protein